MERTNNEINYTAIISDTDIVTDRLFKRQVVVP